jgi:AbrB family looped-hinge helix DNA binding protein
MENTRLSSKGQVIIPASVRQKHDWKVGTEFEIEEAGDGIILRPTRRFAATSLDDVVGCLAYDGPVKTLEEMDEAVVREAKRQAG